MSEKEVKEKKRGVGTVAREAIAAGMTNEAALEAVKAEFPEKNTTLASINWYRGDMRKNDKSIPSARELNRQLKEKADPLED
ncbi:hypothetical protein P67b_00026 [Ruegeria phage Tedan]|nr:hypothetical protein P67b_00026 [Ruegeria phage Tedan]